MLADAFRAEAYRFSINRLQVILATVLVPVLFALGGIGYHLISKSNGERMARAEGLVLPAATTPVNLGEVFGMAASGSANGIILICILIAAATLYAGDYRWETWRLISARNDRASLILAKVGVVKVAAIISSLFFLIASLVFLVAQAMIYERGLSYSVTATGLGQAGLVWLLSLVRIIQFTMIALLTAVMTRSLLAALFVPWALGFVQGLLGQLAAPLFGWEPQAWVSQLLLPGLAYETLKAIAMPDPLAAAPPAGVVWKALVSLGLWTLLPLAGALAWFRRQDLSKE